MEIFTRLTLPNEQTMKNKQTKYKALKNHFCRFNDGESICECFNKGYKKALQDGFKEILEMPYIIESIGIKNIKKVLEKLIK